MRTSGSRRWLMAGVGILVVGAALFWLGTGRAGSPDAIGSSDTSVPVDTDPDAEVTDSTSANSDQATTDSVLETEPGTSPVEGGSEATTSTTTPVDAPATTLPPLADPEVGRDADQPAEIGDPVDFGTWRITVAESDTDATDTLLDFVEFNEPPSDGHQYVLVTLEGTYQGSSISFPVFEWKLVAGDTEIIPEGPVCGLVPDDIYAEGELANGDTFSANICFDVPTDLISRDLVMTLGLFDAADRERFFRVVPES